MGKEKIINNIRMLAVEMINNANSGHSGIALGGADILYSLYSDIINVMPNDDKNIFRDRFVMSAGHGSALLYSVLYACGFKITKEDLFKFRQGGLLSGHPEINIPGVDCATGPLGTGVATAVGFAIAEKMMESRFNKGDIKLFNNFTYAYVGDGCLMEGVSYEALTLAGILKLNKLIVLYDSNKITLDNNTKNTFDIDILGLFSSLNFNVIEVVEGNCADAVSRAILQAKLSDKPTLIKINTHIGYKTKYEDSNLAHGKVLNNQEIVELKKTLNLNCQPFDFEKDVKMELKKLGKRYSEFSLVKNNELEFYKKKYPTEYNLLNKYITNKFYIPFDKIEILNDLSTREISGQILNFISNYEINLIGGSADVSASTKAKILNSKSINCNDFNQRNIDFGVREFAMSCISNGLALYGGFNVFCSTFLVFSDQLKNGLRLACFMNLGILFIFTHDSIAVGEDGPTHQPVETICGLRAIPNNFVFRPCNYLETIEAYKFNCETKKCATLILSRQNIKVPNVYNKNIAKGAYVISSEKERIDLVLIATGSEVELAIKIQKDLQNMDIDSRVVSMLCTNIYDIQDNQYKENLIPKHLLNVFIEAGATYGLDRYVGDNNLIFGIDKFGISDNANNNYKIAKIDEECILNAILNKLNKK